MTVQLKLTTQERAKMRLLIAARPTDQDAALRAYYGSFSIRTVPGGFSTDRLWALRNIRRVKLPGVTERGLTHSTGVDIHRHIEYPLMLALRELKRLGLSHTIRTWNGCWVVRSMRSDNSVLSRHSWAVAFDINASTNRMGTPGDQDPRLVEVLERLGFVWGGRWTGRYEDPMHFQLTDPLPGIKVAPWQDKLDG